MIIKTMPSPQLIDFLKKEYIVNLNILGILENEEDCEIYVDSLKNPNGVLVRLGYFNYLYTQSDEFLDEILNEKFKEGSFGFSGVKEEIAGKIKGKYKVDWENRCGLYFLKEENLNTSLIKNPISTVNIKDAPLINYYYEFKGDKSLQRIEQDILNRPSSGVYVNNVLVSWVLVHNDNSMGIMYTKKEHRNKNYALEVTIDLAKKILDMRKTPFLQIIDSNKMSPGLASKAGFTKHSYVNWFGISI